MPVISKRGESQNQSPIRSLVPYSRKAQKEGKKVYYLNIGQPDIETPKLALEAIRNEQEKIIKYGPSEGLYSLRKKVAKYYDKFSANISAENVLVTTGASEAIMFALLAVCDNNDEVIIPEPFYANYISFAQTCNVNIVPINTKIEDQFKLPTAKEFKQLITEKTKAIVLCNPGNPTGQLYSKSQLREVVDLVVEHDLFLIVDEVYREFCYDKEFYSVLAFDDAKDNVIVLDSISKLFSSCGARVGYLISKNDILINTIIKYAQQRLCPPHFGQVLAEACYDNIGEYIEETKKKYDERRKLLFDGLSKIAGVKCYLPDAAFYNIVELPVDDAEDFCKWMLSSFTYENSTVMMAPANGFYGNTELGKSQVRIAYVLNKVDLSHALICIKKGLEEYRNA